MAENLKNVYDRIYRYSFYRVRDSAAAEDITQESFLRFFSHSRRLQGAEDTAYLYTIARNLCADYFRRKRESALPETLLQDNFSDQSDTRVAVRSALDALEEPLREILLLRYLGDLSVSETAGVLGISRYAVYRGERAALEKMKKCLKKE